jgi:hypothetical protein
MYQPDLSPYGDSPRRLNVGWLENGHPFPQGEVPDKFAERLFRICLKSRKTRGFHLCTFCPQSPEKRIYSHKGKNISFGSGEIAVKGKNWKTYVAPDLIYHYVVEHHYSPPPAFIEAVLYPRRFLTFDFAIFAILLCVGLLVIASNHLPLATLFLMLVPISLSFLIIMGAIVIIRFRKKR